MNVVSHEPSRGGQVGGFYEVRQTIDPRVHLRLDLGLRMLNLSPQKIAHRSGFKTDFHYTAAMPLSR